MGGVGEKAAAGISDSRDILEYLWAPAYPNNGFLPATDGGTPDCVQDPRDTFCLDHKKYPKERILYLLENKMFDVDSILMDESRDSYVFESRSVPPVNMYGYEPLRPTYEPPRQTYDQPHQTYKPPRQSYGPPPPPPPPPPSAPSNSYLPPRQNNFSTTSKPYHHPPPPPLPPPSKYSAPHHTSTYGGAPYHYGTPAPPYDNEGPYPRYRKTTTPSSSYLTRYLPPPTPPRSPPKPQPWWRKVMRSSRRRQKRQLGSSDLCPYEEDYIMPRAALNNKGTWMFLVNMEEVSPAVHAGGADQEVHSRRHLLGLLQRARWVHRHLPAAIRAEAAHRSGRLRLHPRHGSVLVPVVLFVQDRSRRVTRHGVTGGTRGEGLRSPCHADGVM
ncbi:hypothetical protein O3P69_003765 [Scylla paramamosain]|uniref:Uncharacterized protein n=1 Tax=Scylla paramamosain TaxID=85552 RepID=A0AAW0UD58_SCYPA